VAVVVALLVRFGGGPLLAALRSLHPWVLMTGLAVTAGGTLCAAYRWRQIATALAVPVGWRRAVGAYYGSQLLNSTLPGGVLGDLHRGLRHGQDGHPLGRSLRSVAWERALGQAISVLVTATVLLAVPSPLQPRPVVTALVALAAAALACLAAGVRARRLDAGVRARRRRRHPRPRRRMITTVRQDWQAIAHPPGALLRSALASVATLACTVALFVLSAVAIDPGLLTGRLLPVALVVLLVGALPINVAGWGPREGAAAWAFAAAGWDAEQGLSVSVVFGVLALVGTLPGVVVLVTRRRRASHG